MASSMFSLGTMPLFGETVSPYDEIVEKVTAETCTSENWTLIVDICDKVLADQPKGGKLCLLAVKKRLNHRDPHVVLLALSVLDSLWSNCGAAFRREVSSREFSQEIGFKATHSNRAIGDKTRAMVKKWAENECKKDPSLGLIETLYKNLVADGHSFDSDAPPKNTAPRDPNAVYSAEEEDAIARAIALSLDDSNKPSSVYPSTTSNPASTHKSVERKVRALYDFEAVEDNELTFVSGDIITVVDDSDPNWWRGRSARGEGLFPASFVTADVNPPRAQPEPTPAPEEKPAPQKVTVARIDEQVLVDCLRLLDECDPTGQRPDPPELADIELRSLSQAPLIDGRLAEIDRQHNALAQVDIAIRDVLGLYDRAVQQVQQVQFQMPQQQQMPNTVYGGIPQQQVPLQQVPMQQQWSINITPKPGTS